MDLLLVVAARFILHLTATRFYTALAGGRGPLVARPRPRPCLGHVPDTLESRRRLSRPCLYEPTALAKKPTLSNFFVQLSFGSGKIASCSADERTHIHLLVQLCDMCELKEVINVELTHTGSARRLIAVTVHA